MSLLYRIGRNQRTAHISAPLDSLEYPKINTYANDILWEIQNLTAIPQLWLGIDVNMSNGYLNYVLLLKRRSLIILLEDWYY